MLDAKKIQEHYQDLATEVHEFIEANHEYFPKLHKKREKFAGEVDNIHHHQANLGKSLVILLFGGTGTGKSTLINALAGEAISSTNIKRAHTENYIIYHHQETSIDHLQEIMEERDQVVPHERENLKEKIIIDAPDFDSLKELNHKKVRDMLELADLVFCVVTTEKYRDNRLYKTIKPFVHSKNFIFIYNKYDRDYSERVEKQFIGELSRYGFQSPLLYRLSARNAFRNQLEDTKKYDMGQFPDLTHKIYEELNSAQIEQIKSRNLYYLLMDLLDGLEKTLSETTPQALEQFQKDLQDELAGLSKKVTGEVTEQLLETGNREIVNMLRSIYYFSFGGVFGIYMSIVDKLMALKPGYSSVGTLDRIQLKRSIKNLIHALSVSRIRTEVNKFEEKLLALVSEIGLEEETLRDQLKGVGDTQLHSQIQEKLSESISEEMLKHYDRLVVGSSSVGVSAESIYYNAAPVAFVILVIANMVYQFFVNSKFSGLDYLISSLVMLAVICFIQQTIVDKKFTRLSWNFLGELQDTTSENIGELMSGTIGRPIRKYIENIEKTLAALADLRERAQQFEDVLAQPSVFQAPGVEVASEFEEAEEFDEVEEFEAAEEVEDAKSENRENSEKEPSEAQKEQG